jgi:putative membrane-bound dehydrogenase-like protein
MTDCLFNDQTTRANASGVLCALPMLAFLLATVFHHNCVQAQGFSPTEAVQRMTPADGLQVTLFASEPEVRQPIFVKCDDRGRLWTIQYLQYPNPAGLKRVNVDRWSRTEYDRVPKPPPYGPQGADRITILEDTNGDGRADQSHDFVDGLNLVTGLAFGHGGVFVLNVPYLLFYPDRNRDDVPDTEPEVLLTGFGMEDAQSMSNHLTWGPDGWLYGVNGSTTTCRIRGIEFQQGVWRYHPKTRQFELFCEGGSNCYGLTFDRHGELYYSTNGGPFVHAVQGGYYFKSFGKHGPLHNLHAYHFYPNLTCDQVPGGPPTGGTIYRGESLGAKYRDKFLAGNFLGHTVSWWRIEPVGSTVRAWYGGLLADSHDPWCGPTDLCTGPDGAIYFSDFYDQRTAHPDPDAHWDVTNGRIYKLQSVSAPASAPIDLGRKSSAELVDLLSHPNGWFSDQARCLLASSNDRSVLPQLRTMAQNTDNDQLALQALWALHGIGGLDESLALKLLTHPQPYLRFWTVRLLGDRRHISSTLATRLAELASNESNRVVLAQLAATARRLPVDQGLPIVRQLLWQRPVENDERIEWLLWWAIEEHAMSATGPLLALFTQEDAWSNRVARENGLRLVRRWAAEGSDAGYQACLHLLESVPANYLSAADTSLVQGLAERAVGLGQIEQGGLFEQQAVQDDGQRNPARKYQPLSAGLRQFIKRRWQQAPNSPSTLKLALQGQINGAYLTLLDAICTESKADSQALEQLLAHLELLRKFGQPDAIPILLNLVEGNQPDPIKISALEGLARFDSAQLIDSLLGLYPQTSPRVRDRVFQLLLSRSGSARALLAQVELEKLDPKEIPLTQLSRLAIHQNQAIDALVRKHWGNIGPGSSEEKLATMRRYSNDLRAASGDWAQGKPLFTKHCGICHRLFGEGNQIGPDLTTANRKDRAALLGNIIDPSAVIRREYVPYVAQTDSGQVLTGLLAEQNAAYVTLLDAKNERIQIPHNQIELLESSNTSLMPERILKPLTPQELRDLFAYLESEPEGK